MMKALQTGIFGFIVACKIGVLTDEVEASIIYVKSFIKELLKKGE